MKKLLLNAGIIILGVLFPITQTMAEGGNPVIVSVKNTDFSNSRLTLILNGDLVDGTVNITPSPGFTIGSVNRTLNGIIITMSNDGPNTNFGGKDDEFLDIMTIVGIDNITGVYVDNNSGTDAIHRLVSDIEGIDQGESNQNGNGGSNAVPIIVDESESGNGESLEMDNIIYQKNGEFNTGFSIYPNPVQDEANIVTVGEILGKCIEVYDLSGKVRKQINVNFDERTTINLSDLSPGIYMVILKTEDGRSFVQRINKL